MWIRSQDGFFLQKITNAIVSENNIRNEWSIISELVQQTCVLGIYDTEAEALTVLDKLQRDINWHYKYGVGEVFQMPEKGFSTAAGE